MEILGTPPHYTIIARGELFWTKIFDTEIFPKGLADKRSHAWRRFSQAENGKVKIESYIISSAICVEFVPLSAKWL